MQEKYENLIGALLDDLSGMAVEVDAYEYGLPLWGDHIDTFRARVRKMIDEVVAEERERCALIADDVAREIRKG